MSSPSNPDKDAPGNKVPDDDLQLRNNLFDKLQKQFSRSVTFEGTVRAGTVKYSDGNRSISFDSEMGGGNCLFYIALPTTENWEKATGFSLAVRDEILQYVAEETLRKQTTSSGAYFVIGEREITFMKA